MVLVALLALTQLHLPDMDRALKELDLAAVVRLVEGGADANSVFKPTDSAEMTPLVLAARRGDANAVRLLLSRGAKPDLGTEFDSPLTEACGAAYMFYGYKPEAAELLLAAGGKVNRCSYAFSPLNIAISGLVTWAKGPRDRNRWGLVRDLVDKGADINLKPEGGEPPLFATMDGVSPNSTDVLQYLLDHGAEIDQQYPYVGTVLHRAAESQDTAAIGFILSKGAKIDARNERGETPIFAAVSSNTPQVCAFLLHHGASLGDRDDLGETPIFAAVRKLKATAVQWCVDHGASISARNKKGRTPIALLKSFQTEGLSTDSDSVFTPEHYQETYQVLERAARAIKHRKDL